MRYQMRIPCGENERFAPGSLDRNIGKRAPIHGIGMGTIIAAEIIEEGKIALITFEVDSPGHNEYKIQHNLRPDGSCSCGRVSDEVRNKQALKKIEEEYNRNHRNGKDGS